MMAKLYTEPGCYDSAFEYRDFGMEVEFLESIFRKHSDRKVRSVLDVGCGTGSHLIELAKRGYDVTGIDISEKMLLHSKEKLNRHNLKANLCRRDMRIFTLGNKYDAAITMANTLLYLLTEEEYDSHLNSVANVLEGGGLYVTEFDNSRYWYKNIEKDPLISKSCIEEGDRKVFVKSFGLPLRPKDGIYELKYIIEIEENNTKRTLESSHLVKLISPKEFQLIIGKNVNFELLNYYGGFDLSQFDEEKSHKMIVVSRN
jgi:ubiquinone/menaquinone biosynthesis C-methylase UbiE